MGLARWSWRVGAALALCGCPDARMNPNTGANGGGGQSTEGAGGQGGADGGNGGSVACDTVSECPLASPCYVMECNDHVCTESLAGLNASCGGNKVCDGAGQCVECNDNNQCVGQICDDELHECVPPPASCRDGQANGTETALDCGGDCPPCGNGLTCELNTDCESNHCGGTPPVCSACTSSAECSGDEYCLMGVCRPKLANGEGCENTVSCASGFCVDDVCCNDACTDPCHVCSGSAGQAGACSAVAAGSDPDDDCDATACRSGACDGAGACAVDVGAECARTCSGFTLTISECAADGGCLIQASTACPQGHNCQGNDCDTDCDALSSQCQSAYYCGPNDTDCLPDQANGGACSGNGECVSGNCVDGVCCNNACLGNCRSCLGLHTGFSNGTCANILPNMDPANECSFTCAGAGQACCAMACGGPCRDCRNMYTGQPDGTCGNVLPGMDPDNECPGNLNCNGNGGCS